MTEIEKIRAEIDKLYGEYKDKFHQCGDQYHLGLIDGLDMAERVLDTLESEKPMEGLEEEISRTYHNGSVADTSDMDHVDYENIARHFAEWGYFRAAEKYNEIEYNRQRAEENEKPSVKDAMKELDEKIALVKQRGTWDGVDVDKYMDEVRGRESEKD